MTLVQQLTARCRCGKKVALPRVGAGQIKHGCWRMIFYKTGLVSTIKDKPRAPSGK